MRELYGQRAMTLLSNSSVQIYIGGTKENETANHVSALSGQTGITTHNKSVNYDAAGFPTTSWGRSQQSGAVVQPHDFHNLDPRTALCFIRGIPGVLKVRHTPWFKQWRLRWRFDKNPFYTK
jgi:type IV secretory pathway TraG/TraD family ATPase VirD4